MTELRPLLAAAARRTLGVALGLGLAWRLLSGAALSFGPAAQDPAGTLAVHIGPFAMSGFEITLQP